MGARAWQMPGRSLSDKTARMTVARSGPNVSRQVCARTRAAAGLCAPSMMVRSSQAWNRAGHLTAARPRAIAATLMPVALEASEGESVSSRDESVRLADMAACNAEIANAAFCFWYE